MHAPRPRLGRPTRAPRLAPALLALAPLLVPFAVGCSGSDRQNGTQVQVTEETKAQIQDMRSMYKDMGKNKTKN
jgi:hypothetical protein